MTRRRIWIATQLAFVAAIFVFLGYGLHDAWADALPRIRDADLGDLVIATLLMAAYYCLFVVGWQWILRALRIHVTYSVALQSEMASMLAKYLPGGIWTPAARILWLKKAGVEAATPVVVSSILLEAGLSAISGVLVFALGVAMIGSADAPVLPLTGFTLAVATLLHPRVFHWLALKIFRPFGGIELPELSYRLLVGLLGFYAFSWLVGGAALLFLVRSVGGTAGADSIAFLGGTAAIGAIVAVLSVISPSGLGVREASMYGLVIAVASSGVALGAIVLNRIVITVVEALLLLVGALLWRRGRVQTADALTNP